MLVRLVKMTFRPEAVGDFLVLFASYQDYVRTFPGCGGLVLYRDRENPDVFFTQSRWIDAEALERYRASEKFRDTWRLTKAYFAAPPEAWSVDECGGA
jgi:quinol monooxygenase YgiN